MAKRAAKRTAKKKVVKRKTPTKKAAKSSAFELDSLRELIELMEQHGVTEVNLERDGEKWQLRRGPAEIAVAPIAAAPVSVAATPVAPATPAEPTPPVAEPPIENGITINSPTVGTFYSAPSPDDPAFVSVGSTVGPDTIVCIVEAMKVFNQIPAEVSGRIVEVLVSNGDAIDFGQPLFRVAQ